MEERTTPYPVSFRDGQITGKIWITENNPRLRGLKIASMAYVDPTEGLQLITNFFTEVTDDDEIIRAFERMF